MGIPIYEVDESKCSYYGKCAEAFELNAVVVIKKKALMFPELCIVAVHVYYSSMKFCATGD